MEQTCTPSADIDSTGCCHSNIKSTTATATKTTTQITANTPERTSTITAAYLRSPSPPQMSSKEQQLKLQTHNNHVSDKKLFANSLSKHAADEGRSSGSISMSTPAADNIALFKDDDSRSGSSDDITTPIVDLHHLHQRHHRHHNKQLNGNGGDDDSTPATSTNTIEVIQDHRRRCQELDTTGGVGIYLETPVIDEQIVGLNSHDYEKAKPKRLSDEFLLSSEEFCDDDRNSSSDSNPLITHISNKSAASNVSNNNSSEILKSSGIFYDILRTVDDGASDDGGGGGGGGGTEGLHMIGYCESQHVGGDVDVDAPAATASGSMSSRFKNISIDYHPYDKVENGSIDSGAPTTNTTDVTENDVQSMDAIERRDFEHEQRLTGGIILKSSSLAKNDRLKLELVQQSMQNANNQQRAVSSDSKCTYKDHSTTPTSSRHCSSRLTKSTAKINLSTSLINHPEVAINLSGVPLQNSDSQDQDDQDTGLLCIHHQTGHHHHHHHHQQKQQQPDQPGSSKSALEELSSVASTSAAAGISKRSGSVDEGGSLNMFELILNSNSNDSLVSEHSYSTSSSHSLSHLTKPQQPGCSEASATSNLLPEEELLKKAIVQVESIRSTLQNIQKLDGVHEDEVATTSSSARCQYPALKYIRNSQRKDSTNAVNENEQATVQPAEERVSAPITLSSILAMNGNSHSNVQHLQQQLSQNVATIADLPPHLESELHENEFDDETWVGGEEGSDEEQCTCYKDNYPPSKRDTSDLLSEDALSKDVELSSYIQMVSISEDTLSHEPSMSPEFTGLQRKRKFNESRLLDSETLISDSGRKRIAYDYASTPRSSQTISVLTLASPSTPLGRRTTPRSMMHTRQNPPPELHDWLVQFQLWTQSERIIALDRLIEHCEPTQVRYMMKVIEPQFQRDFISLLPRELALQVLAYLDPKDLLRAAQTCRSWRFLCDDNLLWKEKCRKAQILTEPKTDRPKRGRAGNMPPIASPWKAAYMRQHIIEMNWRSRPIREPKVLKGHDDHVITCLQFSGNRIVSGSDDNTLKVWSAVTGRCLRTLVGHTGGVWSSQMSGNIIISGSTDRTLKVWDMETGQCVHTLLGHTSTVRCMHLHGKKVVSGSRDATLRVWDIERGTCLHVLVGHLAAVRCVQYDGKLIVSGAYDYMVKIWHPERQECLHTLQGHTNRVYSLQFDGIHVVSGSLDTSIRVWDVETGNCKHTLMGHQSLTSGMELRQNILVSGNADSTVKVWDITSGQCLQTLSGPNKHQSAVTCLQFNSRFVITSSDDGTVKLWDVKTGEFIRNLVALDSGGSGGVVWRIRANDTKLICAVGSRNGTEETKLMVLDFDVEGACVKCS